MCLYDLHMDNIYLLLHSLVYFAKVERTEVMFDDLTSQAQVWRVPKLAQTLLQHSANLKITLFIVKHNLLPVNTTIILIIIVLILIHN